MGTKYIVNNVTEQTITGDLKINGNIIVTGSTTNNSIGTYKALLSQTGSLTGTSMGNFGGQLIIGETYTITNYVSNDNFYNVADVVSGGILNFDYVGTAANSNYGYFSSVTGTTSGLGSGAIFIVYWCGVTHYSVSVVSSGVDYAIGDTITILGTDVGGAIPQNNITITFTDANPNQTGCVFIAIADVPSNWSSGSELVSGGDIVSRVLENTLGFDIDWVHDDTGYYVGYRSGFPFTYFNEFPRNDIYTNAQSVYPFDYFCPFSPLLSIGVGYQYNPNDSLYLAVTDVCAGPGPTYVDNLLYFTPIQIQFKKEYLDIYGALDASFPFNYVSLALFCNGSYLTDIYADDTSYVNNMSELITLLNNDPESKVYDISFSEGGPGGITMRMSKDIKNLYCEGELTFLIYSNI